MKKSYIVSCLALCVFAVTILFSASLVAQQAAQQAKPAAAPAKTTAAPQTKPAAAPAKTTAAPQAKPAAAQQAKPAAAQQAKPAAAPAQQAKPAAARAPQAKPAATQQAIQPTMALGETKDVPVAAPVKDEKEKKMLFGFVLGYFVPLVDLGDMVNGQVSGRVFFQYQDIAWWFGMGVDVGYTRLADKTYDGNIDFLNIIAHPLLTFPLGKGFDLQLLFGVGMSVVIADLKADAAEGVEAYNGTSVDPMIDAGFNVMYNFLKRYAVGVEMKYYQIFEDPGYTFNGIEASVFFAVRF